MIKISVIITSYNVENYIEQCLDSVLNQTFKDIEIICIDDCSTDNTYKILEDYKNKYGDKIKVFKNDKNYGNPTVGVNKGIELSKGEYVYILDSDDYLSDEYLYNLYFTAKKYDSDVVSNLNIMHIDMNKETNEESNPYPSRNSNIDKWKQEFPDTYLEGESFIEFIDFHKKYDGSKEYLNIPPWNKLFRKKFLMENNIRFMPIDSGIEGGAEDFNFIFKVVMNNPKTSYNHKAKYYHRNNHNGLYRSINKNPLMITAIIKRMNDLLDYCKMKKPNELNYLAIEVWLDTYYRYRMVVDKKSIYKYMHEFALSMYIDKNFIDSDMYSDYMFIKLANNYDDYLFISTINNDIKNKIIKLNNKINNLIVNNIDGKQNWIKLFGIYNTKDYLMFYLFGIKISFKMNEERVNKLAWWIPIRKWRDNFRSKFLI